MKTEDFKESLNDFISEFIESNKTLKALIDSNGVTKWNEFAQNSGANKYAEQFDNSDFFEHFNYCPEHARIEAKIEFINKALPKMIFMMEAYLNSLIINE
jgi:hypothetical protein